VSRLILVIANEPVAGERLHEVVDVHAGGEVVVLAPALTGRLRFWTSDDRQARAAAQDRLDRCLVSLAKAGVAARGYVGDADPLQAIADALRLFDADEIVIATHPDGPSNWLARDIVRRARRRFVPPIHHVAVEAGAAPQLAAA
jgi:hypothetical protein